MGLFSRGGSILAASICRDVNWRQPVNALGARVLLLTWRFRQDRSNVGVGAELQMGCGDLKHEQGQLLRKPVDGPIVCHAPSRPVFIDPVDSGCGDGEVNSQVGFRVFSHGGDREVISSQIGFRVLCHGGDGKVNSQVGLRISSNGGDGEVNSQVGFRVLSHGEEFVQHIEDHIPPEVKSCGCSSLEIGNVKEKGYRGLDSDMDQTSPGSDSETAKNLSGTVLTCGGDIMQGSIGTPAPGKDCGPNRLETENVHCCRTVDTQVEQNAEFDVIKEVKSTKREVVVVAVSLGIVSESFETSLSSNYSKSTGGEDARPTDQIELVQTNELNLPLHNLPSDCGVQEGNSEYPVPLSPLSGEVAKSIEYERAMVAEAAVKSGPAMTRSGVLFEDEWLMVINKPSGVYCEHVLATIPSFLTPAANFSSLSRLTLHRPVGNKDKAVPHLHMANRLDRDTSGVMVITKCRNAAAKLSNIFTKRQVHKSYIALCRGPQPSWKSLTIDSGHGRSRYGAWRVYSKKDVGRGLPGGSVVRDMTTHLLVLSINKQLLLDDQVVGSSVFDKLKDTEYLVTAGDESSSTILGHSLSEKLGTYSEDSSCDSKLSIKNDEVVIRAIPTSGRTHQIRLHCQFVGLPLRGDVKYGGPHLLNGVRYDHHALHAETLSFRHPFTFEELHFVAPLPQWAIDAGVQPSVM